MSPPFLIIDGYNLMHAAGLARATYGPGDLARKRRELLVKLARRLRVDERQRCVVVFDAIDAPKDLPGRFRFEEMSVLFAEPGHDADQLIETLISQHSAPRRLTIVSSDHRLQNAIRKRRGTGVDSDVFLTQLESPHRQVGSTTRPNSRTPNPREDLDFWMQEFEGVKPMRFRTNWSLNPASQKVTGICRSSSCKIDCKILAHLMSGSMIPSLELLR